jgi:hypothetical protein
METAHKKVAYAFNKFYLNFLNDIKSYNDEFKKCVKSNFKVFDKTAVAHIESFRSNAAAAESDDGVELLPGLSYGDIMLGADSEKTANVLQSYFYIFKALAHIYDDSDDSSLEVILGIIQKIKAGEDVASDIEVVMDDDLRGFLIDLERVLSSTADESQPSVEDTMKMFENSMIGNLAKEISEEINVKDLNVENPAELLNFESLVSGSNNVLGNIVSKVSTKIQSKIANGELNQTDLIGEAMNLITMLNTSAGGANAGMFNDLMSNIGKTMGDMKIDENKVRQMDTRARLQKKLEERKAKVTK